MQNDEPYNRPGYEPEVGRPGARENVDLERGDPYREYRERYAGDRGRPTDRRDRPGYAERGGEGRFAFRADSFLTRMVRNLVGTLLAIGSGSMAPRRIDEILESGDRRLAGPTAPPHGLCLERVVYPGEDDGGDAARVPPAKEDAWIGSW